MPGSGSKLAQLISINEGGWRLVNGCLVGVPGTIPFDRNNPGDLRHSPHSTHPNGPDDIGTIDTLEHGWEDLERQLGLYASRGLTLRELAFTYAPPADNNPTEAYLESLCAGLGLPDMTLVSEALASGEPWPVQPSRIT